ncbi:catalase [Bacillus cereus]|uniref:catalase n=1 Tax=Bacillus cereus group TaxID=86661 RepID=UPI000A3723BF|nr:MULTISPECIES: catalase [Bacillus cereus group]MRC98428.1 catalase [Bacillus thuringiensis]MBR9670116.1 catalase [Bacillus cereus]MCI3148074.1 catalase [Bacillus cereus]MEB8572146.1 catalase [Bacillus cereus]MEC3431184.1 catalase [Bacillus cereus]
MDGKKNKKTEQLQSFMRENEGKEMTTNTGIKISNDENSLTASDRFRTIRHSARNAKWTVGSK